MKNNTKRPFIFMFVSALLVLLISPLILQHYFDYVEKTQVEELNRACNSATLNFAPDSNPTRYHQCICQKVDNFYHNCLSKIEILNTQPFVAIYRDVFRPLEIDVMNYVTEESEFLRSPSISEYGFAYSSGHTRLGNETVLSGDLNIVQYAWDIIRRVTQLHVEDDAFMKVLSYDQNGFFRLHHDGIPSQRLEHQGFCRRWLFRLLSPVIDSYNYCKIGMDTEMSWISALKCTMDFLIDKWKPFPAPSNRLATVLFPLNSWEGGETVFSELGFKVKLPINDVLLFSTLFPTTTFRMDQRHRHGGCEVTRGRKLVWQGRIMADGNSLNFLRNTVFSK